MDGETDSSREPPERSEEFLRSSSSTSTSTGRWVVLATLAAYAAWTALGVVVSGGDGLERVLSEAFGLFLVSVIFAGLIAGAVFLFSRGARKGTAVTYCVVLLLPLCGRLVRFRDHMAARQENRRVVEAMGAELADVAEEMLEDPDTPRAAALRRMIDSFRRIDVEGKGESAVARGCYLTAMEELLDAVRAEERCIARFTALGGTDWSSLRGREDLLERAKLLDAAYRNACELLRLTSNMDVRIDGLMAQAGIHATARRQYLEPLVTKNHRNVEMAQLEVDTLKAVRVQFALLREHFGQFELDVDSGLPDFEDDAVDTEFRAAGKRAEELATNQQRMQREHLEAAVRKHRGDR